MGAGSLTVLGSHPIAIGFIVLGVAVIAFSLYGRMKWRRVEGYLDADKA
jgi:hypothetical protein